MRDHLPPAAPIERIRIHLVSLRMPRALEALDHVVQQLSAARPARSRRSRRCWPPRFELLDDLIAPQLPRHAQANQVRAVRWIGAVGRGVSCRGVVGGEVELLLLLVACAPTRT